MGHVTDVQDTTRSPSQTASHDAAILINTLPPNEEERLRGLYALELLDAGRIAQVEQICRLARDLFHVPAAMVTLIDRDRACFLATSGFERNDIPRNEAICSHAILSEKPLVISDALADRRFAASALVIGDPYLRFYAGAPLQFREGIRLGTLSVIDTKPRSISEPELEQLRVLAELIVSEFHTRKFAADLKRREALLGRAARLSRIAGWELDVESDTIKFNEEGLRICGIAGNGPVTRQDFLERFQDEDDRDRMRLALSSAATQGVPFDLETELVDGRGTRWVRMLAEPETVNGRIDRVMGVVQDITERKETAAQIEYLAYRDPLTGLPNRTQFHECLQRAMSAAHSTGSRHGLLLIDIDHFKTVNNSMGHFAGDALLSALAARLGPAMAPDHTLARIAGDEFAIIVPDVAGASDLAPVANAVIELLKQPIAHDGYALALGVSIGGAIFPDNGKTGVEILKNADIALYRAKADGRSRFVMFQELDAFGYRGPRAVAP